LFHLSNSVPKSLQFYLILSWKILIGKFFATKEANLKTQKTVKSFLFTPIRRIGRVKVAPHQFLTSALNGGKWLTSRPCRFTSEKKNLVAFELEFGCVEVSLDILEKRKSFPPTRIRIQGCPQCSPLTTSTALPRLIKIYDLCEFQRCCHVFRKSQGGGCLCVHDVVCHLSV
jgi:hypothetical protein